MDCSTEYIINEWYHEYMSSFMYDDKAKTKQPMETLKKIVETICTSRVSFLMKMKWT